MGRGYLEIAPWNSLITLTDTNSFLFFPPLSQNHHSVDCEGLGGPISQPRWVSACGHALIRICLKIGRLDISVNMANNIPTMLYLFCFASRLSKSHLIDYEGSAGLRWGDPRPTAQAQPLPSWASRRPPLSYEVHGSLLMYSKYEKK